MRRDENLLKEELEKKSKLISKQAVQLKASGRSTREMDMNKMQMSKKGGLMGSIFRRTQNGEQEEITGRLNTVLEDALLKNMQLQDDIKTLGNEVDRLMEENKILKSKLRGRG